MADHRADAPSWSETIVKSGLSAVPLVGGVLATIVSDVSARHRGRVTEYAKEVIAAVGNDDLVVQRLRTNEELTDIFTVGAIAASRSSLENKRRAMARVVSEAIRDDAKIDLSGLLMPALADLDRPHFAVLSRIAAGGSDEKAARAAADTAPDPVVAGLIRWGAVKTVGTFDGGLAVTGVTPFGERLLSYVETQELA
jgi:hypothetical protein